VGEYCIHYITAAGILEELGCVDVISCNNDDCSGAYPVGEGAHAYDLTGSTIDGPNDCDRNMQYDVWMLYTASFDGLATISTCGQTGSNEDSVIIVYDGGSCPVAGDACLASNDDFCGASGFMSQLVIPVTAGSSYYIQIGGYNDAQGNGTLEIHHTPSFKRGDVNGDGGFNIGDAIFLLAALFSGGDQCPCDDACDANDDGSTNIADAIMMLGALFSGGETPPTPGPNSCGIDPTSDALDCDVYSGC
jgi:hypothetical protein